MKKHGMRLAIFLITLSGGAASFAGNEDMSEKAMDCSKSVLRGGRFHNAGDVDITPKKGSVSLFYKFFLEHTQGKAPISSLPVEKRSRADYSTPPPEGHTRITWMGHSTMLIEIGGYKILTDPNFGKRASPLRFAGPKRFTLPPVTAEDLPDMDVVLISHDHYDHLDYETIVDLKKRTGRFIAPIGVGQRIIRWGVEERKVTELDWWDEMRLDEETIIALTPAQHFSARGLLDRNKTLWGSWVVKSSGKGVYFSGDTGMFECFGAIGEKYGPFDFTLMHIGAYADVWPESHMTPEEAVEAHIKLKGGVFIPMHWGTYPMAFHPWKEPAERLYNEAIKRNIRFATPIAGQMVTNPSSLPHTPWWREYE